MCAAMNDLRHPMPSRDKYPCKDCLKRYPACQDKCPDMLAAKRENNERKAKERRNREHDNAAAKCSIVRRLAVARRKVKER